MRSFIPGILGFDRLFVDLVDMASAVRLSAPLSRLPNGSSIKGTSQAMERAEDAKIFIASLDASGLAETAGVACSLRARS